MIEDAAQEGLDSRLVHAGIVDRQGSETRINATNAGRILSCRIDNSLARNDVSATHRGTSSFQIKPLRYHGRGCRRVAVIRAH
ncbi:hypothetical protein X805_26410 [Sphaerotilus natans subsp. natans DSM 6575]|uniref:Uncharacterized protein n=1 Tax=Sphaerotilus natans subsp. natans DSM 6575 TaxID=1286631 RepID=A0A059KKR4_9BURK|nr:hypothetical protein X805_26410 [Sphaerotilus natans subsp. natans DSM 6575]